MDCRVTFAMTAIFVIARLQAVAIHAILDCRASLAMTGIFIIARPQAVAIRAQRPTAWIGQLDEIVEMAQSRG